MGSLPRFQAELLAFCQYDFFQIDNTVVCQLSFNCEEISNFLCLGDRLALRQFCMDEESPVDVRKKCYENIRKKLKLSSGGQEGSPHSSIRSIKMIKNKNATKTTRKIEFGWVHNGSGVRGIKGGGTRKIDIGKSAKLPVLTETALSIFFPEGCSKRGLKKCDLSSIEICDFSHVPVPPDLSVEEFSAQAKLKGIIRYYLHTTGPEIHNSKQALTKDVLESAIVESCEKDYLEQLLNDTEVQFGLIHGECSADSLSDTLPLFMPLGLPTDCCVYGSESHATDSGSNSTPLCSTPDTSELPDIEPLPQTSQCHSGITENPCTDLLPASDPMTEVKLVRIRREKVQEDMVKTFKDSKIVSQQVNFTFCGEKRLDVQGVTRDVYCAFLTEFDMNATSGE